MNCIGSYLSTHPPTFPPRQTPTETKRTCPIFPSGPPKAVGATVGATGEEAAGTAAHPGKVAAARAEREEDTTAAPAVGAVEAAEAAEARTSRGGRFY